MLNNVTDNTAEPAVATGSIAPTRKRAAVARVVADLLRQQVDRGDYRAGFPTEAVLAAEFDVSRNTIRDALATLVAEGIIDRTPRVGTHVVRRRVEHPVDELVGLRETLGRFGTVRNKIRVATVVAAPTMVARRLHLEPGSDVVYIERLRMFNDEAISEDLTYLTPDIGMQLLGRDLANNDIFALIEEVSGQSLGSAEFTLEAANADPHSADNLGIARDSALLLFERLTELADGTPVDLEYVRLRSDRVTMTGRMPRRGGAL